MKHASLASMLIGVAKNGVLGLACTKKALADLVFLEPHLIAQVKKPLVLLLDVNRAVRTLLTAFREFKKAPKALVKHANASEKHILEATVEHLVLSNADEDWVCWEKKA